METKKSQLEGLPEKTQGNEKGLGKKVQPMIEKEYIEREAAQKVLANDYAYNAAKLLDTVPIADVQEVVRCKDCIFGKYDDDLNMILCKRIYNLSDGEYVYNDLNDFAVTVRERMVMVMTEWIKDYDCDGDYYYCSECGHYLEPYELLPHLIIPNECPDCGAKMDKE